MTLLCCLHSRAQQPSFNFHAIGVENGLHDGIIRCLTQDKFGYIWIGSVGAINRFDGKTVKQFTNIPGDTVSPYRSQMRSMHSDKKGRLWIGCETGLMEYDFKNAHFNRIAALKNIFIAAICSVGDSLLYLGTRKGLVRYNTNNGSAFFYNQSDDTSYAVFKNAWVNDFNLRKDQLYAATHRGLISIDIASGKATLIPVPTLNGMPIISVAADDTGNIWMGTFSKIKLVKLHADLKTLDIYDQFLTAGANTQALNVMDILVDSKNRVWVTTAVDGLLEYNSITNQFIKHPHNSNNLSGPAANDYRTAFQDDRGNIWIGMGVNGVNYFNPDHNFFTTVYPFPDRLDERGRGVARAMAEDKDGNLWMGTHDGVTKYDRHTNQYSIWRNEEKKSPVLYSNGVRTMLCDDENNIWIGTAGGVNRYNNRSKTMEFISAKDLPLSFYNSINKDRSGNIWFCTNDSATLYWYSMAEKKYNNISNHPQLKKYKGFTPVSYVLEDSRNRLWISVSRKGLLQFDKRTLQTKLYVASDSGGKAIIGNQVIDIKEDKKGVIWMSCFNGISGIDTEHDTIVNFNNKNGLIGNFVSSLVIDDLDRIWIGVTGGLMMLDASRKKFTSFSLSDGLPSVGFPEHAGIKTTNGDIVLPSNNGFIRFTPSAYKAEEQALRFYMANYTVFGKEYFTIKDDDDNPVIHLKSNENSFTFNLMALNYVSPSQTWFAYKLEGFEKEWHYTQDSKAVYTNIAGGNYTFLYKASANNDHWDKVEPKTVLVKLKTVFYKSTWFRSLMILLLTGIIFAVFRYRTRQQRQLFQLKSKAQLLEKEKALVMYENLKQQLNPHFLFNSLTSLSGLIEIDQRVASEFLEQMSGIYRYILKSGDSETVLLKDEIEFVKQYITLQQTRFRNGLKVNIKIPDEYLHYKIAPVTLQNLIENAIKHNIIDTDSPLVIDILIDGDYLAVKNNLQKKNVVETSNKKGLAQFAALYRYMTTKPVIIDETLTDFTIKIPLL